MQGFAAMPNYESGPIVAVVGLLCTFLVLVVVFGLIKLLKKIK